MLTMLGRPKKRDQQKTWWTGIMLPTWGSQALQQRPRNETRYREVNESHPEEDASIETTFVHIYTQRTLIPSID